MLAVRVGIMTIAICKELMAVRLRLAAVVTAGAASGGGGGGGAPAGRGAACVDDVDCELNGECHIGVCSCYAGWVGKSCGQLDVLPVEHPYETPACGTAPTAAEEGRASWRTLHPLLRRHRRPAWELGLAGGGGRVERHVPLPRAGVPREHRGWIRSCGATQGGGRLHATRFSTTCSRP